MRKVAFLIDLGFFLPRYRAVIEGNASPPHSPKCVARVLFRTALGHLNRRHHEELYRIPVYDCKPLSKKAHNPVDGRAIDFARSEVYRFRTELHRELVCLRKVALD
jgi:uncharacterized LabA/DUF88 family protein